MENQLLKQGEINMINNNVVVKEDGSIKILNNSICLNKTDDILLRTNGTVCYGLYKMADDKCIEFTLKQGYDMPYIGSGIKYLGGGKKEYFTVKYVYWKPIVLEAFKKAYTPEAKAKFTEVYKILRSAVKAAQNPVVKTEEKIQEKKEEVTVMNNTNAKELNTMAMAHKIRIALGLEGHYYVQMKIAMNLAWQVKRGQISLDELLNKEESVKVAAPTYNAPKTNEVPQESEVAVTKELVATASQESAVGIAEDDDQDIEPVIPTSQRIYLKKFASGVAEFYRECGGVHAPFYTLKARNLRDLDKQFAAVLPRLIQAAPNNTVIHSYGDYTYLTVTNDSTLRALAESKGITLVRSTAPSGDVA